MKKFIPSILVLLVLSNHLFSQTDTSVLQDPAAEPYLDRIAELFNEKDAYQLEFRYEVESTTENYKVEDYGSVIIKGQKYKLKTEEGEVFYDGIKMWTYNPSNKEVYITTPEANDMDQLLTVPFVLMNRYRDYFKYKLKGDVTIDSKIYNEIELYPINLDCSYSSLKIQIEKSSGRLYSFTLQQKNGVYFRIFVTEIIRNIKIPDNTFTWNKAQNPDILIIEL